MSSQIRGFRSLLVAREWRDSIAGSMNTANIDATSARIERDVQIQGVYFALACKLTCLILDLLFKADSALLGLKSLTLADKEWKYVRMYTSKPMSRMTFSTVCNILHPYGLYQPETTQSFGIVVYIGHYEEEANEKHWTILKQTIHTTADEILGEKAKTIRIGWYDKECEEATKKKNLAYKEMIQKHHTRNLEERYREERREKKKIHRRKKKIYF
ncbi:hypothetical protein C0J52_02490 [Blattella germanica]|nr:hypothetical protein C0J52_02490 [Blattella germanica]